MERARPRIGTAGWSLPRDVADTLPAARSGLARYATAFDTVEINSSFYKPHRPATYARWAATVPDDFRFAVKLPKTISHEAGSARVDVLIECFLDETSHLGAKRGPILVQTPPKLAFDASATAAVVDCLKSGGAANLVWEPRHASWFTPEADAWLADNRVARVAADPARHLGAGQPGGWLGLAYFRLHGSPRLYYSAYDDETLSTLPTVFGGDVGGETWIIFDNTASGAAARNARSLGSLVSRAEKEP